MHRVTLFAAKLELAGHECWPSLYQPGKEWRPDRSTVSNNEGDFTFTGLTDTSYTLGSLRARLQPNQ